ncbi:MAG TPA: tetratricopeptide repeat protein [Bacteroidota bacterium]|jgi:outer membrane protein assembly factor BamD (BamD/ComL family)|nr:tetratricopeptide repeat protein [Bacteroidota bacterium]
MKPSNLSIILIILLVSCSRKSDKELYEEGKAAHAQQDFKLAVERFQEVADKSSTTSYAESSLTRIAVIYNNDLHDTRKAIQAYQKIYTLFPESSEAPNALFLTGFLYNNELHNSDSARIIYEAFLGRYANHSLAASAKFELETLGQDPTQLLQSKVSSRQNDKSQESSGTSKQ